MKNHFKYQIAYNNWANERILHILEDHKVDDSKILSIFSHMISSQIVWLLRIRGLPTSPFPLWENYNRVELRSMLEDANKNWVDYLETHQFDTFEEMIFYSDDKGKKYETTIRQIIGQVLIHSSHHRGQINLLLKQNGIEPPLVDYIYYTRTH